MQSRLVVKQFWIQSARGWQLAQTSHASCPPPGGLYPYKFCRGCCRDAGQRSGMWLSVAHVGASLYAYTIMSSTSWDRSGVHAWTVVLREFSRKLNLLRGKVKPNPSMISCGMPLNDAGRPII